MTRPIAYAMTRLFITFLLALGYMCIGFALLSLLNLVFGRRS
jgi:hypothetical protein